MSDDTVDWTTREGLADIRARLASQLDGYRSPEAYGIALSSATSDLEWEFGHINAPGGEHRLPAVVLATILEHDATTTTIPLTTAQLEAAIESLTPAEGCTDMDHPNLAHWREVRAALADNPAREAVLVWIDDVEDPVSSEADGEMRAVFEG